MIKSNRIHLLAALLICMAALLLLPSSVKAAGKYEIYVNRQTNIVNVLDAKSHELVRSMYCSTGVDNRTITGTYTLPGERYEWRSLYGDVYGQYATRISGPYLFHSVPYTTTSPSTVEVEEFNQLGKQASLGCVRLAVADSKWIYDNCEAGTSVTINDTCDLVEPKYDPPKLSTDKTTDWDPTDTDSDNPYKPTIKLKKGANTIKQFSTCQPLNYISVKSDFSSSKELLANTSVKGKIDTSKTGKYKLTYTVTDPRTHRSVKKTFTFKVVHGQSLDEFTSKMPTTITGTDLPVDVKEEN